ncbi:MAG: hypothetical protein GXP31_10775 [Kiritimatiellaeota bacterium]|nr:hypothetical protein [Kiritimatiellota bacterium]
MQHFSACQTHILKAALFFRALLLLSSPAAGEMTVLTGHGPIEIGYRAA